MIECHHGRFLNPAHVVSVREHDGGAYRVIEATGGAVYKCDWSMMRIGQAVMRMPDMPTLIDE